ncbi:MAG: ABC transporter permease [Desulfobacteraceae bacterium]|nr:MAG: ABC transporter permease [Desulfobacteraceae bacterium]
MSIRRIKALTKKEFIQMSRDIRSLMGALFNPLLMIFLFGYALSLDVDRIPTVVLDLDRTPVSREFIHRLTDSRYFTLVRYLDRDGDVDASLAKGEALMALVIPLDFASKVKQGIQAPIQVVFDGSDSNTPPSPSATSRPWLRVLTLLCRNSESGAQASRWWTCPLKPEFVFGSTRNSRARTSSSPA